MWQSRVLVDKDCSTSVALFCETALELCHETWKWWLHLVDRNAITWLIDLTKFHSVDSSFGAPWSFCYATKKACVHLGGRTVASFFGMTPNIGNDCRIRNEQWSRRWWHVINSLWRSSTSVTCRSSLSCLLESFSLMWSVRLSSIKWGSWTCGFMIEFRYSRCSMRLERMQIEVVVCS